MLKLLPPHHIAQKIVDVVILWCQLPVNVTYVSLNLFAGHENCKILCGNHIAVASCWILSAAASKLSRSLIPTELAQYRFPVIFFFYGWRCIYLLVIDWHQFHFQDTHFLPLDEISV